MNNKRTNSFAPIPLPEALRLFVLCLAAGGCLPLVRAEEPKGPGTKKAGLSRKATWSSQEEWNRDKPTVAWVFPFIDKNSDGKIDADEYQAIQEYKKKHRDWQAQARKELALRFWRKSQRPE